MNRKGQAIVEVALVLPVVIFVFAVMYYLILFVRTEIQLRESAYHIAYKVAVGQSANTSLLLEAAKLELTNARWGILNVFRSSVREIPISQWRSYTGVGTLNQPGQMVRVDLFYELFPHTLFQNRIPWMTLHAHCELPVEPVVPL